MNINIKSFTIVLPFDYGQDGGVENCTVTLDDFTVVDNSFDLTDGVLITQNALSFAGAIGLPTPYRYPNQWFEGYDSRGAPDCRYILKPDLSVWNLFCPAKGKQH